MFTHSFFYARNGLNEHELNSNISRVVIIGRGLMQDKVKSRANNGSCWFRAVFTVYTRKTIGACYVEPFLKYTLLLPNSKVVFLIASFCQTSANEQP